ncbi:Nucleoside-diphosphate-sugar epimerases [hydrothermal vent metagenome]|uniref:Nucleoside-diphosphate-sugar epimerases n=1 Tax=hydrothermal vent metagenome TaxID=652676 RepID=A0A3B0S6R5_9ZZZZ
MTHKLFCFGLGYTAQNLIRHLTAQDSPWPFSGTHRHIFDGTAPMPDLEKQLSDVTHMLISIPPQDTVGDVVLHHHREVISKLKKLKWLGYLSTTGIYGDRGGAWVDDDTAAAPTSDKGRQRLKAEQDWLELCHSYGIPVHIFRLGSLYGPNRGHLVNLLSGKTRKIVKQGHYFSRIHIEDVARVLAASIRSPDPGRSYNLVDDQPAPTPEVLDFICDLLNRPHLPPTDINKADLSPMMRIFYSENKRVRNDRIKQELGIILKYPTYREGFAALVKALTA